MRRSSMFWGAVLILAGILALLSTLGILTINIWALFWPLFLVALGVWILWGSVWARRGGVGAEAEQASLPLNGASRARLAVRHGAGRLSFAGGAAPDLLFSGTFGGGLDLNQRTAGDMLDAELRVPTQGWMWWGPWGPWNTLDWDVRLNENVPISLNFNTGAGESRLDLSNLRVTDLVLKTGASATTLTMPANAGMTRADIETGAAALNVQVPSGVAARIRVRSGLAGISVDSQRFPRQGDLYLSPDYETAANKLDMDIQTGVGSVDIR